MTERRSFPGNPVSVTNARRFALGVIADAPDAVVEAVAIAVSELAANCVRHAGTDFTVAVERTADAVRVAVGDSAAGVPAPRAPKASEFSGRGLLLVRALSDEWGVTVTPDGAGKSVWFTVSTAPSVAVRDAG